MQNAKRRETDKYEDIFRYESKTFKALVMETSTPNWTWRWTVNRCIWHSVHLPNADCLVLEDLGQLHSVKTIQCISTFLFGLHSVHE